MIEQGTKIKDYLDIVVTNPDGSVAYKRHTPFGWWEQTWARFLKLIGRGECYADDIVVDGGLADIANMVKNRYGYMSIGTVSTTTAHGTTALGGEVGSRSVTSNSLGTTYYANDTVVFTATFLLENPVTLREAGIHLMPTSSGDIMLCRETYAGMACTAGQTIALLWKVVFSR